MQQVAFWCALGAAATTSVSIAAFQILLGAALAAMLAGRMKWRLPAHWQALAFFAVWTLLSLALSDLPRGGLPQIRKFYVWAMLFVVVALLREVRHVRWLVLAWLAGGTLSALRGLWQFGARYAKAVDAHQDFYHAYVGDRITGFMSHWMTFSGQLMIVLLASTALLLWGRLEGRLKQVVILCLPIVAMALILALTRGIWIATAIGLAYLLWYWRSWSVVLIPVVALAGFYLGPPALRQRIISVVRPEGTTDSNLHRVYTFRTGIEMIKAHPWFGLGPERVGPHFREYVPADLPKELPDGYYGHLHNIYVHFAAERGLPAMLALMYFLFATMWDWLRAAARAPDERVWIYRAGVAIMIGVMVTGLFEYNLGDSEILGMTLAAIGAVSGQTEVMAA